MANYIISLDKVNQLRRGYAHVLRKVPGANHTIEYVNLAFPFIYILHYFSFIIFVFGNYIVLNKAYVANPNVLVVIFAVIFIIAIYYIFIKNFLFKGVSTEEVDKNSETRKQDMKVFIRTMLIGFTGLLLNFVYFTALQIYYE